MAIQTIPDWLQQVFDNLPLSLFCRDPEGRYLFCNRQFAAQAGVAEPRQLIGQTDHLLPWGDRFVAEDRELLASRRPLLSQQLKCEDLQGDWWVKTHKVPFYANDGTPLGIFGVTEEISHFKGIESALLSHQNLLRHLIDAIPDLICLARTDGSLLEYNQALLDFLALTRNHPDLEQPGCVPGYGQLPEDSGELALADVHGERHLMEVTRLSVTGLSEPASLLVYRDITGLRSTQLQLNRARHFDSLTGLMKLATFLDKAQRLPAEPSCLLMVDLQHFREINDRFGIRIADQLLSQVAIRLQDSAPAGTLLCRLAADDFCLLAPISRLPDGLMGWCHRLGNLISAPYAVAGHRIQIDCHMGIAEGLSHDAERLLGHAEAALARAKEQSAPFHFFDPVLAARVQRRKQLEQSLPSAIRQQQLYLVYQPIMYAADGSLHGAEVLSRWRHPELGMIPPDEFIPLAEHLGLISQLGLQVAKRASLQLAQWRKHHPALQLSVNLSPLQFRSPALCHKLQLCVKEANLPTNSLELEITESVLMENAEEIDNNLRQLQAAGFPLAIDDFGTGYCSLSYLPRLKVTNLKLDRSFINELENDATTTAIVRSVIGLAHALGIQLTAEGVETEAQRAWLTEAGCQRLQGYLFSPPLAASDFAERFLDQDPLPHS